MKIITHTKILLGIALLGTAFTSVMQTAEAHSQRGDKDTNRRGDWRENRDNDRDDYRNRDRNGRRGNYRDQPPTRYRYNDPRYNDPRYNDPRYGGYGNSPYGYGNNGNNSYGYGTGNYGYGNGGYDYGNYGNNGYENSNQSFTGRVTKVKSRDEFDIRIGNTTYNVYTDSRVSRALSVGDIVRVYGKRVGKNDIRNASASLLSNR